jgi:hypothetical protein
VNAAHHRVILKQLKNSSVNIKGNSIVAKNLFKYFQVLMIGPVHCDGLSAEDEVVWKSEEKGEDHAWGC